MKNVGSVRQFISVAAACERRKYQGLCKIVWFLGISEDIKARRHAIWQHAMTFSRTFLASVKCVEKHRFV